MANIEEQILNAARQDPTTSTRRIGLQLGVRHIQVWNVLHREGLHPYHHTPVQDLLPQDLPHRSAFCRTVLLRDQDDDLFLPSVLWTDESQFTRDGINNFHNVHTWASQNPHETRTTSSQYLFKYNV